MVTSIVSRTCSGSEASEPPAPHRLALKTSPSKASATTTTNIRIGSSFATVTIRLIVVACRTPRAISPWNTHTSAVPSSTAGTVSPSPMPGTNSPIVAVANTR